MRFPTKGCRRNNFSVLLQTLTILKRTQYGIIPTLQGFDKVFCPSTSLYAKEILIHCFSHHLCFLSMTMQIFYTSAQYNCVDLFSFRNSKSQAGDWS